MGRPAPSAAGQEAVTPFCAPLLCVPGLVPDYLELSSSKKEPLALVLLEKGKAQDPLPRNGVSAQAPGSFAEGQLGPALTPTMQPGAGLSLSPSETGVER